MIPGNGMLVAAGVTLLLASGAAWHLHRVETNSMTIYTTPALRDLLERGIFPAWTADGGLRPEPVYVAAGEQYNRLRMSGARSEADLFLHASPLYIAKGFDEGYFRPIQPHLAKELSPSYRAVREDGGVAWAAWAWSPLVEVYSRTLPGEPDLATANLKYGLAHPTLSNNGIYTALFFEAVSPEAGRHALDRTVVQPVNARTNILGVADGSFDVTLGYEAVAMLFQKQGAKIEFRAPLVNGNFTSTAVLFCVGLVDGPHQAEARAFVDRLFTNETQELLAKYNYRSVYNVTPPPSQLPPDLRYVQVDWADWPAIERLLPRYEVNSRYG